MSIFRKFIATKGAENNQSTGKICLTCGQSNLLKAKFCSSCGYEFKIILDHFDAFISYRRETGSDLASLLKIQLENRFNKQIFLDVNELQVGRFDEELLHRIEETNNFIVILSRASLDRCANKSDWLKREIMQAIKTRRNIIPVLTDGFSFPSDEVWALLPPEMRVLSSLNGITYSHIHQDSAILKIAAYMKGDSKNDKTHDINASKLSHPPITQDVKPKSESNIHISPINKNKPAIEEKANSVSNSNKSSATAPAKTDEDKQQHTKEIKPESAAVFLLTGQCLIIDRQNKKEIGPRYLPGSAFEYLRKDEDDYGWYLLKEENTVTRWIRQGNITLEDRRTFFQIEGRSSFGYLLGGMWDDFSGGQIEKISFNDSLLGTVDIKINQIENIVIGSESNKSILNIKTVTNNTFNGVIIGNHGMAGAKTDCYLVCPDALINLNNPKNISIVRVDKKDLKFPHEETITDIAQQRLKIKGRSNIGHLEGYNNFISFNDSNLGPIKIKINRIKRIDVDVERTESPVIAETYDSSIFTGNTNSTIVCEDIRIQLDKAKQIVLEAI